MEIWKDITQYEGLYQVSNFGNVKSLPRKGTCIYPKKLKIRVGNRGYSTVTLSKNNIKKSFSVHRLVANAFIPNLKNLPQVNHIDGNKLNNNVENLEWVTAFDNIQHSIKTNLKPNDKGYNNCNSKLSETDINYIRTNYIPKDKLYGCRALARKFGVSKSTISYIVNYITYC